jgi:YidC/Oxa1 family membrane protein insertase
MDERRLLLAVALSLLVLTAYSLLFPPAPRPREGAKPTASSSSSPAPSPAADGKTPPAPAASAPTPTPSVPRVADAAEKRVEVTGSDVAVAFSNRGARLLSWGLVRFKDKRGRPEELVRAAPGGPRPLDIETEDPEVDARLKDALFLPSSETLSLGASGSGRLTFRWSDGEIQAEKELVFQGGSHLASIRVSVERAGRKVRSKLLWGPGIGNPTPEEREVQGFVPAQGILWAQKVEHVPVSGLPPTGRVLEDVSWVGVESQYFTALFVPPGGRGHAEIRPFTLPPRDDGKPEVAPILALELKSPEPVLFYAGPKDYHQLERAGHGLAAAVPVGDWIGPIVVWLISLLRWVHSHVGNYGWSIIVMTALINLVMAPFRHYSIANSLKMSKMSPEMRVIQERYRKVPMMDPKRQQMQEEMAKLYARHGMNMGTQMLVGCLPLLLTMPFLIAFYRVLTVSIELRGASFLWIPDLSQKDPLFLTPVLMGASMFLMQKMMPSTLDPAQQRVMMIMPLMLSGMFLWAPAGLNLYWLASNLCSIVQQTLTLRILGARDAAEGKARAR